jgi:hypothetical protein
LFMTNPHCNCQCFEQSHWAAKVSKKVNRSSEEPSGQLEIEHLSQPMLAPFEVFYGSQWEIQLALCFQLFHKVGKGVYWCK